MAAYAFMESAIPRAPARNYSAASIECPSCHAEAGEACAGPRVCSERWDVALGLVRRGELAEAEEKPMSEDTDPSGCADCGLERTQRGGHPAACHRPSHRCQRWLSTGTQCRRTVVPGGRWCESHTLNSRARRWN